MSRRPLIAGNWKMNGLAEDARTLARGIRDGAAEAGGSCELLVCPPATAIAAAGDELAGSSVAVGGQDCHVAGSGAHTGDISAAMLRDLGCSYVIVGHSERRTGHGEGDALVHDKAAAARAAGLAPIICIGETEQERDDGRTLDVVLAQLSGSCPRDLGGTEVVIAYEPVWAIGTGRTPTAGEVQEAHAAIRNGLASHLGAGAGDEVRLLYGGSMKPDNAESLLALPDVDGGLIGGASLNADDFLAIAGAVHK